jgi:hypothetical protein
LHLSAWGSDHNPLLLDTVQFEVSLSRPFKFEEFWTHHLDCYSTITLASSPNCFGSPGHILNQKLCSTKAALKLWNRLSFGNIQHQIISLTSQLDALQHSPNFTNFSFKEQSLQKAIDNLMRQEEILWRNKSREQWLSCKDLNTKFFHLSTIIKRRRNAIDFLKLSSGAWVFDRQTIGNILCIHFVDLFASSQPSLLNELLNLFDHTISSEDNFSI